MKQNNHLLIEWLNEYNQENNSIYLKQKYYVYHNESA